MALIKKIYVIKYMLKLSGNIDEVRDEIMYEFVSIFYMSICHISIMSIPA